MSGKTISNLVLEIKIEHFFRVCHHFKTYQNFNTTFTHVSLISSNKNYLYLNTYLANLDLKNDSNDFDFSFKSFSWI